MTGKRGVEQRRQAARIRREHIREWRRFIDCCADIEVLSRRQDRRHLCGRCACGNVHLKPQQQQMPVPSVGIIRSVMRNGGCCRMAVRSLTARMSMSHGGRDAQQKDPDAKPSGNRISHCRLGWRRGRIYYSRLSRKSLLKIVRSQSAHRHFKVVRSLARWLQPRLSLRRFRKARSKRWSPPSACLRPRPLLSLPGLSPQNFGSSHGQRKRDFQSITPRGCFRT